MSTVSSVPRLLSARTLRGLFLLLLSVSSLAIPTTPTALAERINVVPHDTPIDLYGPIVPGGWLGDNSILTHMKLLTSTTYETMTWLRSGTNPNCQPMPYTFTLETEYLQSWTKDWSTTESASLNSELSTQFQGIGTKLEAGYSVGFTVGEEKTNSVKTTVTETIGPLTIPARGGWDIHYRDLHIDYAGELTYYKDTWGVGGNYTTKPWTVSVLYKRLLEPRVYNGPPCPIPEIDPASCGSVVAFVVAAFGFVERRARRRSTTAPAAPAALAA
jgi:hypothetical protein